MGDEPLTAADLDQFRGGGPHHPYHLGGSYSEGVRFVAEKGKAWWLVGAILSCQKAFLARREPFQVWTLRKLATRSVLEMTDGSSPAVLLRRDVEDMTFPLNDIELFFADGVLMLPGEQ
jgi:hypothetical protein